MEGGARTAITESLVRVDPSLVGLEAHAIWGPF